MGILIEGLIKLKKLREDSTEKLAILEAKRCDIDNLVKLYDSIDILGKRLQLMNDEGDQYVDEGNKLKEMKGEFNYCWNRLTSTEQHKLVQQLIKLQLLPELLGESLEIFGGRFISII